MANLLAPLYAQLPDFGCLAEAEGKNWQLLCTIDPLIGATPAVMCVFREISLIREGKSRTPPETLRSYIKSIKPQYPEDGEPRDIDDKDILLEGERAYEIMAEIYLDCGALKWVNPTYFGKC